MITDMVNCRVLVISPTFFPDYAGWLKQTMTMIQACDPTLVAFTWISPQAGGAPAVEKMSFLTVRRVGPSIQSKRRGPRIVFGINAARYLVQNKQSYDLVYCPQSYTPTDIVSLAARLIGKPVVVRIAQGELTGNHYGSKLRQWLLPRLASGLIVLNREQFDKLAKTSQRDKIHWIPNGVDTDCFYPPTSDQRAAARKRWQVPDGEKMILFVGSIVPRKGVDTLVSAFIDVQRIHSNCSLYLVGPIDGAEEKNGRSHYVQSLQALIEEQNLGTKVHFLGRISDVAELMRAADVFVLPSLAEGMPNVLLEAMASGLPCIASNIPGNREVVVDGFNGVLFKAGDNEALSMCLKQWLTEPADFRCFGMVARTTIEQQFSIQHTAQRYQQLFRLLAGADSNAA
jgi:glycosyltransferase involved in cell wall biosynthesis